MFLAWLRGLVFVDLVWSGGQLMNASSWCFLRARRASAGRPTVFSTLASVLSIKFLSTSFLEFPIAEAARVWDNTSAFISRRFYRLSPG